MALLNERDSPNIGDYLGLKYNYIEGPTYDFNN